MPAHTQLYEMVIGLEVHVQLSSLSKAFCGDDAAFGGAPNSYISAVSLAYPGTLPRSNEKHLDYAVRLGLALGCQLAAISAFDRKNYFYADLPKGYQITQDKNPICTGGGLDLTLPGYQRYIRLHHIHMEEDAGKLLHDPETGCSYVDLNRAGVALLEIVTEPDFRAPEEVEAFMYAMRRLVRYLGISDGNMEEGSLRCDCNISVRKRGETRLNHRCEIKNLNSMRFARRAIEYEFQRQVALMDSGKMVEQQTLHFDAATGTTHPMRDKEDAHDYRYFPDPDLPPIEVSEAYIQMIRRMMPELPWATELRFIRDYNLSPDDARLLTEDPETALYYDQLAKASGWPKPAAHLVILKILPWCTAHSLPPAHFPLSEGQINQFLSLIESGKLSHSIAYQRLLPALIEQPDTPVDILVASLDLIQSSDADWMEEMVRDVLAKHPDKVKAFYKGKKGLMGFFMGELMKMSKGKMDPKTASILMERILKEKG